MAGYAETGCGISCLGLYKENPGQDFNKIELLKLVSVTLSYVVDCISFDSEVDMG